MFDFADEFKTTFANLVELYDSGRLKCNVDFGNGSQNGPFKGLDSITEAVEVCCCLGSYVWLLEELPFTLNIHFFMSSDRLIHFNISE